VGAAEFASIIALTAEAGFAFCGDLGDNFLENNVFKIKQ
jgi:hypothetical protein